LVLTALILGKQTVLADTAVVIITLSRGSEQATLLSLLIKIMDHPFP
jgi:hypothetical protein